MTEQVKQYPLYFHVVTIEQNWGHDEDLIDALHKARCRPAAKEVIYANELEYMLTDGDDLKNYASRAKDAWSDAQSADDAKPLEIAVEVTRGWKVSEVSGIDGVASYVPMDSDDHPPFESKMILLHFHSDGKLTLRESPPKKK